MFSHILSIVSAFTIAHAGIIGLDGGLGGEGIGLGGGVGLGQVGIGGIGLGNVGVGLGHVGIGLGQVGIGGDGLGLGGGVGLGSIGVGHVGIAAPVAVGAIATKEIVDVHTPAKYEFKYGVSDPKTGDQKQQSEVRVGDVVKGEYSLAEPDGTIRVVKYTADKHNGFNAVVSRIGHAVHPQPLLIKKTVVPVASVPIAHGGIAVGSIGGLGGGLGVGGLDGGIGLGGLGHY